MSLLSVTDLINILFVDVPSDDDDDVAETTEQQGGAAGAPIVLPSAGECNFWPRISLPRLIDWLAGGLCWTQRHIYKMPTHMPFSHTHRHKSGCV